MNLTPIRVFHDEAQGASGLFRGPEVAQRPVLTPTVAKPSASFGWKAIQATPADPTANACDGSFTFGLAGVMESQTRSPDQVGVAFSHASSKKGHFGPQLMRDPGLGSYRTAWFMRQSYPRIHGA